MVLAMLLFPVIQPTDASAQRVVGHWRLDEAQGETIADVSGGENHGEAANVQWMDGPVGGGVRFSQGDARINFPRSEVYGLTSGDSFTVEMWIRTVEKGFSTALMAREGGAVSFGFTMGREPGKVSWELWSWDSVKLVSHADIADAEWHHVIGAHDAETNLSVLIVDGQVQATAPAGQGGAEACPMSLGNNIPGGQPFPGEIAELKISEGLAPLAKQTIDGQKRWTLLEVDSLREMQRAYLERMAAPKNPSADSVEEWEDRAHHVRRHVLRSLGLVPAPERVPLNVRISGQLDRGDYIIQRVYWQTWPEYYASGYLYLPKNMDGKAPAILNPHGHWANGLRNEVVQSRMISLAKKGYVCLGVDSVHAYDYHAGITPISIMHWNNMRGIDLLCSLPDVDADRIGVTGCSGGGQQAFYLMATEERVKAAVTVGLVCEARRIMMIDSAHCSCNHVAGLLSETDQTEISACVAPKPSLFISMTGDWTKWFPEEGYPEIESIFSLYGKTNQVDNQHHDSHHDYNQAMREQAYAWFNRWLKGIDDPEQANEPQLHVESLATLAALDDPPEDGRGAEAVFEEARARRAGPVFETKNEVTVKMSARRVREDLAALLAEPAQPIDPLPEVLSKQELDGMTLVRALIRTEADIRVPVVMLLPDARAGRVPAVVIASGAGKASFLAANWDSVAELVQDGICVVVADPRFMGEWALDANAGRMNGIFLGRPPAAVGSHDLMAVASWLRMRPEIQSDNVGVVGVGDAGPLAVISAALDPGIAYAIAPDIGRTYAAGRVDPTAPHLVTVGDLPEIAASCAPRSVLLGEFADAPAWSVTERAYAALGERARLKLSVDRVDLFGSVRER